MFISIILWFIFGVAAGIGATMLLYRGDSKQIVPLVTLGIVGGLIGGSFGQIMASTQTDFNMLTPLVSLFGAALLIGLYKNISPST